MASVVLSIFSIPPAKSLEMKMKMSKSATEERMKKIQKMPNQKESDAQRISRELAEQAERERAERERARKDCAERLKNIIIAGIADFVAINCYEAAYAHSGTYALDGCLRFFPDEEMDQYLNSAYMRAIYESDNTLTSCRAMISFQELAINPICSVAHAEYTFGSGACIEYGGASAQTSFDVSCTPGTNYWEISARLHQLHTSGSGRFNCP